MSYAPSQPISPALVQGAPAVTILRLAAPTVVAMLTQSVVNEIDIVFFSWLPCPESSNASCAAAVADSALAIRRIPERYIGRYSSAYRAALR